LYFILILVNDYIGKNFIKFDKYFNEIHSNIKNKICIYGCKENSENEKNCLKLPCKCRIFPPVCCLKFKTVFNFSDIQHFNKTIICVCSYAYSFYELIDIVDQLKKMNIIYPRNELCKKIQEKYDTNCMLCMKPNNSRRLIFKDEKICKFLNVKDFAHLLCDKCVYKNK